MFGRIVIAGALLAATPLHAYDHRRDSTDISPYYRYYYDRPERAAPPRERSRTHSPGVPVFRDIPPGYKPFGAKK